MESGNEGCERLTGLNNANKYTKKPMYSYKQLSVTAD